MLLSATSRGPIPSPPALCSACRRRGRPASIVALMRKVGIMSPGVLNRGLSGALPSAPGALGRLEMRPPLHVVARPVILEHAHGGAI